jgi:hypothetical protein
MNTHGRVWKGSDLSRGKFYGQRNEKVAFLVVGNITIKMKLQREFSNRCAEATLGWGGLSQISARKQGTLVVSSIFDQDSNFFFIKEIVSKHRTTGNNIMNFQAIK